MASEWRECRIGEIAYINQGRYLPPNRMSERWRPATSIPIWGAKGIIGWTDTPSYPFAVPLVTCRGNGCGLVQWTRGPASISNNVMAVVPRTTKPLDARYLYYALLNTDFNDVTTGSAQPQITIGHLSKKNIFWPDDANERAAIAHILGTLDDKIELNRRMSETLEAMARALFKAWFVDFEPVRAKMEGRWQRGESLPGLPAHLYDLFPDRLVDSELGEIPEGWRVGCVDDVFDLTMGQSPPGETYNEVGEGIPFYQGRADFTFRFPERRVYCTAPTRFAKKGDTLISVRAPVGAINMALEDCAIGRGVAAARHKTGAKSYTYYFMQGLADVFSRFESEGTVFGSISKKDFHAIQCVIVPSQIVEAFEQLCEPVDDRIEAAEIDSRTLAALRDALLPKLVSGEIRVKDAEKFLKERGLC